MANGNGADESNPIVRELRLLREEARKTNTRLESMDTRLESMDTRLESMDTRLESVDARLTSLEQATVGGFRAMGEQLSAIRAVAVERHLELDQRVRTLETKVDGIQSELRRSRE